MREIVAAMLEDRPVLLADFTEGNFYACCDDCGTGAMPFAFETERDDWCDRHKAAFAGHQVLVAEDVD